MQVYIGLPQWLNGKESAWSEKDSGSVPGSGTSPGEGKATHSSILAWEIPWTEEPGGSCKRVGHARTTNNKDIYIYTHTNTHTFPWEMLKALLKAGKDWRQKEKRAAGDDMVKIATPTQWTWTWANSGKTPLGHISPRTPGEGNGDPLQFSCLENLMYRGAWRASVHGVAKSQTWLRY